MNCTPSGSVQENNGRKFTKRALCSSWNKTNGVKYNCLKLIQLNVINKPIKFCCHTKLS